jgi:hypothetical protein
LLGPAAKPAWPALIKLTHGTNGENRIVALSCLAESEAPKEILRPVLLDLIHDSNLDVKQLAAKMFRSCYPKDVEAASLYKASPESSFEQIITNQLPAK